MNFQKFTVYSANSIPTQRGLKTPLCLMAVLRSSFNESNAHRQMTKKKK